jgi:hypothetical protein
MQLSTRSNPHSRNRNLNVNKPSHESLFGLACKSITCVRFMHKPNVPFTNNLAEQAIRSLKVKQKISGCLRAEAGAQAFCTIRSYLDTARKQGIQMRQALRQAFLGEPLEFAED